MDYSPTVRGRRLMREITRLRHEAGLSMDAAAQRLDFSRSKLYRLENGRGRITTGDLHDMLDLYGVHAPQRDALVQLGRDARKRGWWTAHSDVFTGSYISMEAEAAAIKVNAHLVPGFRQTPQYAHAVIARTGPWLDTGDVARRVAARTARQHALLDRPIPAGIHGVLDESVLHRQIGGPDVTSGQLAALAQAAARPNLTLQVLPYSAGAAAGLDGEFVILTFPAAADAPVAYAEGLMGDIYLESEEEVERYQLAWTHLLSHALSPDRSTATISQLSTEYR